MRDGSSWIRWDMPDPFSHGRDRKSPIPKASDGKCKRCGRWSKDLGNFLCVRCWDHKSGIKTREEDDSDDEIQSES
jgi:hypothetical protein